MLNFHRVLIPLALLSLAQLAPATGWAADGDARAERLRARGERAEQRADHAAPRVER